MTIQLRAELEASHTAAANAALQLNQALASHTTSTQATLDEANARYLVNQTHLATQHENLRAETLAQTTQVGADSDTNIEDAKLEFEQQRTTNQQTLQ